MAPFSVNVAVESLSLSAVNVYVPEPKFAAPASVMPASEFAVKLTLLVSVIVPSVRSASPLASSVVVELFAPLNKIPPVVAVRLMAPADVRVMAARSILSFVSAALSASPLKVKAPVSVVTATSTSTPSSALAVSVLKVEALLLKITRALSRVALSVTVPETLLEFAAEIPWTVIVPFVPSPMMRLPTVNCWISAPDSSSVPAVVSTVFPRSMTVPAVETRTVAVPVV